MKVLKLKDGQIGTVVKEWNWKEYPIPYTWIFSGPDAR